MWTKMKNNIQNSLSLTGSCKANQKLEAKQTAPKGYGDTRMMGFFTVERRTLWTEAGKKS